MMEWQPIETAPKVGDLVLVAYKNGTVDTDDWVRWNMGHEEDVPTHWMPLPEPPKELA